MIPVTKTYLPPLEQYVAQIKKAWQTGWVTNNGALTQELTEALKSHLGLCNLELVANGTLALQLAIKALDLKGEIITTPFSYVATTTAILWEGCEPVFVDIEENTLCIDAGLIEAAISERTCAILATHVYGYACNVQEIERIARKYNLKVIYDAAHAFGVKLNGTSLMHHGDISAMSFHATKLFHTTEGGALVCKDDDTAKHIGLMKKFGHMGEEDYLEIGINAKISELHAAMGLCVLPKINEIIAVRRELSEYYDCCLADLGLMRPRAAVELEYNYAYYSIVFTSHELMTRVHEALVGRGIVPRRYFYPSLNTLPYLKPELQRSCPISESISSRVLCLPLYVGLNKAEIEAICAHIKRAVQDGVAR